MASTHRARLKQAREMKIGSEELNEMESEAAFDYFDHQDNVRAAHSRYLVSRASELIIPLPDSNDKKMWVSIWGGRT